MGGRTFRPGELDSTVSNNEFGCYPGQEVKITRGLPERCNPSRITVVGEYPYQIVFKLEFDLRDSVSGDKHTSWNYSITKVALMCGDAVLQDAFGHTIRPKKKEEPKKPRRTDGDGERPRRRRGYRGGYSSDPRYAGSIRRFDWHGDDEDDDLLDGGSRPGRGGRDANGGYDDSLI